MAGIPSIQLAHAQAAASGGASVNSGTAAGGLEELVVTARKRSENVEKVPMTVTAITANDMREKQIETETDLQRTVPGLVIRQGLTQNQINYSIRGQTIDSYSSSPPGVLGYVNDVQFTNSSANAFYDLESIQVLKGPQGTLFGRNTTGGAVLFTTKKPTFDYTGDLEVHFGDYADKEVMGGITIPIIEDKVALRVAGDFHQRDGYVNNIYNGGGDPGRRDLGAIDNKSARVSLLVRPVDELENLTVFQYTETGGTNLPGPLYSINACGAAGLNTAADCVYEPAFDAVAFNAYVKANPSAPPGGLAAYLALQRARGPYTVDYNSPSFFDQKNPYVTNTTTYEINPDLSVKNIFGWGYSHVRYSSDVDGTPYTIFNYGPFGASTGQEYWIQQWSDEMQLQGKALDEKLDYIVGVYWSKQKVETRYIQDYFQLLPLVPNAGSTQANVQPDTSEALFAQGSYDLGPLTGIDGLKFTAGVRYTREHISSVQLGGSSFPGPDLAATFRRPSWTFGFEYQMTPELMLYVTQRGSWRTGGFNAYQTPVPGYTDSGGSEFPPETTKDIEVGAKFNGTLWGRGVRLNIDAYDQWIYNVQRTTFVTLATGLAAATSPVPDAEVRGIELDGQASVTDWLQVGASLSYADARFLPGGDQVIINGQLTKFGPYADTPQLSSDVYAEIMLPVPEALGEVSLRGDLYAQTHDNFSSTGGSVTPGTTLPGYKIVNFRLDWSDIAGSDFSGAFYINNAFDQTFYSGGLQTGSSLGLNTAIPGPPRMFGVDLRYKF